tara:strand:+ start:1162 stop:1854 length:693 start_codon:yes stop_codon:yes gene_type:complete
MDNARLLNLYFSLVIFQFISIYFELDFLHIVINVLTAPTILLIYLRMIKFNFKWYFIIVLISLYFTDLFHLLTEPDINNMFCVFLNAIAYFVLTIFIFKTMKFKNLRELDFIFYLSFSIVFLLFLYVVWVVNDMLIVQNVKHYPLFFLYSMLVFVMSVLLTIKYIVNPNRVNTNLQVIVVCFVVNDVFYVFYVFYNEIHVLKYMVFLPQLLVYYFLLSYELNRNKIFEIK